MDQVKMCFERIRVIRGVNYGIITNEQIRDVFMLYQLSEDQQKQVYELLQSSGIYPIPEEEANQAVYARKTAQEKEIQNVPNCEKRTDDEKPAYVESREERFEQVLRLCEESIKENALLIEQYQKETYILKNAIAECATASNRAASRCVTQAVMEVSRYRVRDIRKKGWVCGTHMSRVKSQFERWLCWLFTEDELKELIRSCSLDDELNPHHQKILLVLLHNTPQTLVHPGYSQYFDD